MFKVGENILYIFEKLNSMMKTNKCPGDWSLTSFLSAFVVTVPILLWVIISSISNELLSMPEGIVIIVVAGITGKVYDKKAKLNGQIQPNNEE